MDDALIVYGSGLSSGPEAAGVPTDPLVGYGYSAEKDVKAIAADLAHAVFQWSHDL